MTREEDIAGAVAFTRNDDAVGKEVGAPVILKSFGDLPEDFAQRFGGTGTRAILNRVADLSPMHAPTPVRSPAYSRGAGA
jgi:hypothetical protein